MSCQRARKLIHPYIDGELDTLQAEQFRLHLGECEDCNRTYRSELGLSSTLKDNSLYYRAPRDLDKSIRLSLREEVETTAMPQHSLRWGWLILGGSLAVVLLILTAVKVVPRFGRPSFDERVAQEIVSNHIRSLQATGHLTDVLSSDQHTVKPWFNGKVDFSPPVNDFETHDFRLYGGRLEYIDSRTVSTLIYQRRSHYINLYIWPAEQLHTKTTDTIQRQGYNLIHWTTSDMNFWAISDLNSPELTDFAKLFEAQ